MGFLSLRLEPERCALLRPSNPTTRQAVASLLSRKIYSLRSLFRGEVWTMFKHGACGMVIFYILHQSFPDKFKNFRVPNKNSAISGKC